MADGDRVISESYSALLKAVSEHPDANAIMLRYYAIQRGGCDTIKCPYCGQWAHVTRSQIDPHGCRERPIPIMGNWLDDPTYR